MKLFNDLEAFRFPQENLILITRRGYLYYIYKPQYNHWYIHKNHGNDMMTVSNYPDISREELVATMGGKFPEKETDILRLCFPDQLNCRQLMNLLEEDYPEYMSKKAIHDTVYWLFHETDTELKLNEGLKKLFDKARLSGLNHDQVLKKIRELDLPMTGRDIFRKEIRIIDGHVDTSYFHIHPVRVVDCSNTENWDNIANMESVQIAIEEDDVAQYLLPFLKKYFDDDLEANRNRIENRWTDDDGNEHVSRVEGFEWYLTYNFFNHESIANMLRDIRDTADALASGRKNEYTDELKIKRGLFANEIIYARGMTDEQIRQYNENRPKEDDTEAELIIDFYNRFIYRMEYMMKVGKENGYDLISFMGP